MLQRLAIQKQGASCINIYVSDDLFDCKSKKIYEATVWPRPCSSSSGEILLYPQWRIRGTYPVMDPIQFGYRLFSLQRRNVSEILANILNCP